MTNEANEKLIMLAQMTSESDSSSLKSLVQVYLPILVFIIVGIAISITGIWFTKEWEKKLDSSITTSIQDHYFNDVLLSLKQLTHDSTLVKGFFDASEFVSNDEFQTFTHSLLTHNPSTEFCLIIGYGDNPSEHYFNTREDITHPKKNFTPETASEEILEIRKSLRKNHGENIVITTNNSSYIV